MREPGAPDMLTCPCVPLTLRPNVDIVPNGWHRNHSSKLQIWQDNLKRSAYQECKVGEIRLPRVPLVPHSVASPPAAPGLSAREKTRFSGFRPLSLRVYPRADFSGSAGFRLQSGFTLGRRDRMPPSTPPPPRSRPSPVAAQSMAARKKPALKIRVICVIRERIFPHSPCLT
jgi:hypothetical protein